MVAILSTILWQWFVSMATLLSERYLSSLDERKVMPDMCKTCIKRAKAGGGMMVVRDEEWKLLSSESQRRLTLLLNYKCPAMICLENLTPSGSEFVDDPEYCYRYIRGRIDKLRSMLKKEILARKAREHAEKGLAQDSQKNGEEDHNI